MGQQLNGVWWGGVGLPGACKLICAYDRGVCLSCSAVTAHRPALRAALWAAPMPTGRRAGDAVEHHPEPEPERSHLHHFQLSKAQRHNPLSNRCDQPTRAAARQTPGRHR